MPIKTTQSIGGFSVTGEPEPALRAERLQTLGSLACGIAHDLNNVLTPILLGIETLKLAPDRRRTAKILAMVEANARQVAELADQVLAFAKGIEGKRAAVNVTHLMQDAARTARETFGAAIETRTRLHPNLWWVNADPTQIHQILLNLAVNARDAMAEGGMLTLSACNVAVCGELAALDGTVTPGDYVEIKVADTGRGIPPALLEAIFEPFFTTKGVGRGVGIGLSTVAGIVGAHGGFVTISSVVGEGTEFAVYLPALACEGRHPAPAEVKAMFRANERLVDLRVSSSATVADLAAARRSRAE
jgi:two-component system, cell cycle sensor histidine kinase and response regulator CckA